MLTYVYIRNFVKNVVQLLDTCKAKSILQ